MKVYVTSDLHIDYPQNGHWLERQLGGADYRKDVLIVAGDISDDLSALQQALTRMRECFAELCFVPGNHELWLQPDEPFGSLAKFERILALCKALGVHTQPLDLPQLAIVPLFSWYDLSFGEPDRHLLRGWRDFHHCRWEGQFDSPRDVSRNFLSLNKQVVARYQAGAAGAAARSGARRPVISFSHFLPRIDVMPRGIPRRRQVVYPVLGSSGLDEQLRRFMPDLHVYGHSHVNRSVRIEGIHYVNNALAYPRESHIATRELLCVFDSESPAVLLPAGHAA
jgi:predicted phosphodiesterase